MTDEELESFMTGVGVWEAMLWPDPLDKKVAAKKYAACIMLQQLYEVLVTGPRRSSAQVGAIVKAIVGARAG